MAHKVFFGGFGSSKPQMERVALALSTYYDEDVAGISFRHAMNDRSKAERLARGADLFTHSAGMLAVKDTAPHTITSIAPPLPTPEGLLIAHAATSGIELAAEQAARRVLLQHPDRAIDECIGELGRELSLHMYGNLKHIGRIALFNAIESGIAAKEVGIPTRLGFMKSDKLFIPNATQVTQAQRAHVPIVMLTGGHEQMLSHPYDTITEYETLRAADLAA